MFLNHPRTYRAQKDVISLCAEVVGKFSLGMASAMFVYVILCEFTAGKSVTQTLFSAGYAICATLVLSAALTGGITLSGLMIGATAHTLARITGLRIVIKSIICLVQKIRMIYRRLQNAVGLARRHLLIAISPGLGSLIFRKSPHLLYPLTCSLLIYS